MCVTSCFENFLRVDLRLCGGDSRGWFHEGFAQVVNNIHRLVPENDSRQNGIAKGGKV